LNKREDPLWGWADAAAVAALHRCVRGWMTLQRGPSAEDMAAAAPLVRRLEVLVSAPADMGAPEYVPTEVLHVIAEFGGAGAFDSPFRSTIANMAAEIGRLRARLRESTTNQDHDR